MSTYLFGFVVGNYSMLEARSKSGVLVSTFNFKGTDLV
jgi:aminopeptidase N